ncbi:hypothetical protein BDN71DRAFT_1514683 [Pleurotus eryngii]|uniref:Uncharacterized protein n=1 Tax=Pleurotus eryngii TaxID=5323 RepID=A0A9P5ZHY2_PLEER|nr:hypothetical protein BDN71DRAFT_1514683 [Pleurotus eryngii]
MPSPRTLKRPHPRSSQSSSQNRQPSLRSAPLSLKLHSPHLFVHLRSKPSLLKTRPARSPLSTLMALENSPNRLIADADADDADLTMSTMPWEENSQELREVLQAQQDALAEQSFYMSSSFWSEASLSQDMVVATAIDTPQDYDADNGSGSESGQRLDTSDLSDCQYLAVRISKEIQKTHQPPNRPLSPFELQLSDISLRLIMYWGYISPDFTAYLDTLLDPSKSADARQGATDKIIQFLSY